MNTNNFLYKKKETHEKSCASAVKAFMTLLP